MPYTPTYDDNGSLTSDGVWTFTYNVENQLTRAEKTGIDANYEYDPYGRRSKKSGTGVVTEVYLNNGSNEIADYDGTGTVLRRYIHGPGIDEPVAMTTGTGFTTISYYHADYLGSIVAMSDNTGALSEQYRYSPYGEVDDTSGNPFRYTGRRLDAETGLYYYRARYYSPTLGRFLQVDPIGYGDGLNNQAYVGNDPINASDPSGTTGTRIKGKDCLCIVYQADEGGIGSPLGIGIGGSSGSWGGTDEDGNELVTVIGTRPPSRPLSFLSFFVNNVRNPFLRPGPFSRPLPGTGSSSGEGNSDEAPAVCYDPNQPIDFAGFDVTLAYYLGGNYATGPIFQNFQPIGQLDAITIGGGIGASSGANIGRIASGIFDAPLRGRTSGAFSTAVDINGPGGGINFTDSSGTGSLGAGASILAGVQYAWITLGVPVCSSGNE